MKASLSTIAAVLGVSWEGEDRQCDGVCIDSRELTPGCVFVALKGERFDGHDFVQQASQHAAVCVVSEAVESSCPVLVVEDTLQALTQLAAWWRQQYTGPVLAITGSCGKTTVRALLSAVMATQGSVHASIKSYNNHIGVPLTLLGIEPTHDSVVAEVGTSAPGEIAALAALVQPTIAVITLAAPVHLDGLGSLAGVVSEKGALVRALTPGGVAILNADDAAVDQWVDSLSEGVRTVSFGVSTAADVMVTDWKDLGLGQARATLSVMGESRVIQVRLVGAHHASNVAAACAAAYAAGVSLERMPEALASAQLPPNRLVGQPGVAGSWLIDDSFNANPLAVSAAIQVLVNQDRSKKILVLGDMKELADQSAALHAAAGREARSAGVDNLLGYGDAMQHAVDAFGDGGAHFQTKESLLSALHEILDADTAVLVKGSHSMHMDEIVQGCMDTTAQGG